MSLLHLRVRNVMQPHGPVRGTRQAARRLAANGELTAADHERDRAGLRWSRAGVTQAAIEDPAVDEATPERNAAREALAFLYTGEGGRAYELIRRLRPAVPFGSPRRSRPAAGN